MMSPARNRVQNSNGQYSPKPLQERGASARNLPPRKSGESNYNRTSKHASQIYNDAAQDAENVPPGNINTALLLPKLIGLHTTGPVDSALASPETTFGSPETSIASPETITADDEDYVPHVVNLRQSIDLIMPSSSGDSLPLSEDEPTEEIARQVPIEFKRASTARLSDYSIFPSERLSQPPRSSLVLNSPRMRSQSTASTNNNWHTYPGSSPASMRTPDLQRHRRASSSPTASQFGDNEDAGLGIQGVQYQGTRLPSGGSVESTPRKSSGPARRLQRKRAVSNFGRTASGFPQHTHSRTSSVDTGMQQSDKWAPMSNLEVVSDTRHGLSVSPVPEEQQDSFTEDTASGHWERERADVITELERPELAYGPSFRAYESDKTGPVGSFYHFLNDSYTAWARIYYGNENSLSFNHSSQNSLSVHERSRDRSRSRSRSRTPGVFSHFSRFSRSSRSTTTTNGDNNVTVPAVPQIPRQHHQPQQHTRFHHNNSSYNSGSFQSSTPSTENAPSNYNTHIIHKSKASNMTALTNFTSSTRPAYFSGMPDPQQYPLHITNPSTDPSGTRPPTSSSYSSWDHRERPAFADTDSRIESPSAAGFPDRVYVPRIRPRVQQAESVGSGDSVVLADTTPDATTSGESQAATSQHQQRTYSHSQHLHEESYPDYPSAPPITPPHLHIDRNSNARMSTLFRAPSFVENKGPLDRVNRQIWLFCIGFIFPLAWLLAAILPIPKRPTMRRLGGEHYEDGVPEMSEGRGRSGVEPTTFDLFDKDDVMRWQKARRWRLTNRIMSGVGLCLIAVIGACAGVAAK